MFGKRLIFFDSVCYLYISDRDHFTNRKCYTPMLLDAGVIRVEFHQLQPSNFLIFRIRHFLEQRYGLVGKLRVSHDRVDGFDEVFLRQPYRLLLKRLRIGFVKNLAQFFQMLGGQVLDQVLPRFYQLVIFG